MQKTTSHTIIAKHNDSSKCKKIKAVNLGTMEIINKNY
jgi:hypothetical protein